MNDNTLENITTWASLYFPPREICTLEQLPWDEFEIRFLDEEDPVHQAFMKGVLQAEAEQRAKIKKLARDGSPAAQLLISRFLNNQKQGI